MADDDVQVSIGATIGDLVAGVEQAKGSIEGFGESLKGIAELAGVAFTADMIKEWITSTAELGEQMERSAAMLGITAQQASELSGMARLTGTDFDSLTHIMERFELGLTTAEGKSSRVGAALKALGLDAREFIGVPLPKQLEQLSEAFSKFADGPNKTAAAMALLGRAGAEMLPFLDRGKEGMAELETILAQTGAVMSNTMAAAFAHTKEDISTLGLAVDGFSNKLYAAMNGPVDLAIQQMTKLVESVSPAQIKTAFDEVAKAAIDMGESLAAVFVRIQSAWDQFSGPFVAGLNSVTSALNNVSAAAGWLGDKTRVGVGFLFGGGALPQQAAQADAAFAVIDASSTKLAMSLKGVHDYAEAARAKLAELSSAPGVAPEMDMINGAAKPNVPAINLGGGAQTAAEEIKSAYDDAFKTAETDAKTATEAIDNQLKLHQITAEQAAQQIVAAYHQEADAITAAAQKATQGTNLSVQQQLAIWVKASNQIKQLAQDEANAQAKAAEQSAAVWKSAADQIAGAMNSQVDALLRGTETLGQAFKKILASMIEDVIKFLIKWAMEQAATIAANTASYATGAAAQKAINASTISGDAGRAAAGAYAAVAGIPIIGPVLAPAAAAVAFAGVEAFGSFDQGSWNVPHDMIALIHEGEKIVPSGPPAQALDALTAGGAERGGFGGSVSLGGISFPSFDPSGMRAAFENHKSAIVKSVMSGVRDGIHLAGRRGVKFA